ncbi:MAG: cytochrome ubiquinol oxidase subunit I [Deltaproteobacteria bacterium]|nr:cytochrome ubiquinol oxidase subunit I [Deltaproteobacteria bacterium]
MDSIMLARLQFAFTIIFHFLFPPISIGMGWVLTYLLWKNYKHGGPGSEIEKVSYFWTRIFAIVFAVGVATGITMEFQFGTNWSGYSRYVGDIFGAPLAAEAIFAFFLESTFLGVLVFGWNKVSRKTLWFSALMVAVGSTLSAFWIIVANSWMQTPAGYQITGGRAELVDFWAAVFNPSTLPRYFHTVAGALITGSFFVMGISAWFLLKGREQSYAKISLKVSLSLALVASLAQLGTGHWHAIQVFETQPEKFAAVEGHFETMKGAPALLFGVPSYEKRKVDFAVKIPKALSLLATGDPDAEVRGLNDFSRDEWPPLMLTFYPFHLMVALGMYFIGFTLLGALLWFKGRLFDNKLFLKLALFSLPLPLLANELGWMTAEVGRQPWIVYRMLKTADAVSVSVPAWQLLLSLLLFVVIYGLLFFLWVFLIKREMNKGFGVRETEPGASNPAEGRAKA